MVIFSRHNPSLFEYELRTQILKDFANQIADTSPKIQRTNMEYCFYEEDSEIDADWLLFLWSNMDVYIMEESLFEKFQLAGISFSSIELEKLSDYRQAASTINKESNLVEQVQINQNSYLYRYICNWENRDKVWVAVIAYDAKHMEEALSFLRLITDRD
ncbi:MAG: hypothetical protein GX957_14755 [Clostridiaceae bacterium]|nr:hypothetical protein [Clostridiaceae bacterium]